MHIFHFSAVLFILPKKIINLNAKEATVLRILVKEKSSYKKDLHNLYLRTY